MRTGAASVVGARRRNENDVIMRAGAATAVGARSHDENDVTMTIAGLWRYGDLRHVATGCTALVLFTQWQVVPGSRNIVFVSCRTTSLRNYYLFTNCSLVKRPGVPKKNFDFEGV